VKDLWIALLAIAGLFAVVKFVLPLLGIGC